MKRVLGVRGTCDHLGEMRPPFDHVLFWYRTDGEMRTIAVPIVQAGQVAQQILSAILPVEEI